MRKIMHRGSLALAVGLFLGGGEAHGQQTIRITYACHLQGEDALMQADVTPVSLQGGGQNYQLAGFFQSRSLGNFSFTGENNFATFTPQNGGYTGSVTVEFDWSRFPNAVVMTVDPQGQRAQIPCDRRA